MLADVNANDYRGMRNLFAVDISVNVVTKGPVVLQGQVPERHFVLIDEADDLLLDHG